MLGRKLNLDVAERMPVVLPQTSPRKINMGLVIRKAGGYFKGVHGIILRGVGSVQYGWSPNIDTYDPEDFTQSCPDSMSSVSRAFKKVSGALSGPAHIGLGKFSKMHRIILGFTD